MENIVTTLQNNAHQNAGVEAAARTNLQRLIDQGKARSAAVMNRVFTEVPEDRVLSSRLIVPELTPEGHFGATVGGSAEGDVHDHALGQLCKKYSIPKKFWKELSEDRRSKEEQEEILERSWRQNMALDIMEKHLRNDPQRMLVRSYGGQHRAFLSDRFKRLDSRPLLEEFHNTCESLGAVPVEGLATDVKTQVRYILPRVIEPVPGEAMVLGLNWSNSDYGAATYQVNFFAIRLLCTNGMVGDSQLKKIHLGRQLPDDLQISDRTMNAETALLKSATTDMVRSVLSEDSITRRCEAIKAAHEKETTFESAFRSVRSGVSKAEAEQVKAAFEGTEEVLLPVGQTKWRFSNALSWVANTSEDPERKMELQALAGRVAA